MDFNCNTSNLRKPPLRPRAQFACVHETLEAQACAMSATTMLRALRPHNGMLS